MSRQITEIISRKFMNDESYRLSNSEVRRDFETTRLYLFGNLIARKKVGERKFEITMAGYSTPTTRERLNGLPNVRISQKNYAQYLNGKEIDTDAWYTIEV